MNFVAYIRVSTDKQRKSGLGLDAQREAVNTYVDRLGGRFLGEYQEAESGKNSDRPELARALQHCRDTGATLIVAKLDRLARDTAFLLKLTEEMGDGGIAFCDLPDFPPGPAGRFMLTMFAAVAELERGLISDRTKAALAAAKARGVKLGNPNLPEASKETAERATAALKAKADETALRILPYITDAQKAGADTYPKVAEALTARGIKTPRGGTHWTPTQISRIVTRAKAAKLPCPGSASEHSQSQPQQA